MEENKPGTPEKTKNRLIFLPLILALVLAAGFYLGMHMKIPGMSEPEKKFFNIGSGAPHKITDILFYIQEAYVDSVDREALTQEAIEGILRHLDPHSSYIPASAFRQMNDPLMGSFEGIGIEFNMILDTVVVISPIVGGPSEKAGIMAGDRIVMVEGEVIAGVGMSTDDVVSKLKGRKGTEVNVSVRRNGVPDLLDFKLTRDKIPSFSLDIAYMVSPEIGYISLNKFSATTHQEFTEALAGLQQNGMSGLILDLRGNGGGFLDAAIRLTDELLEPDQLIVYTDGRRRPRNYAFSKRNGLFESGPLVVLIDEWSASASEIVAGAVQDNDRGLIVGRRSFGKGLVQEQVQLSDGSALRLTVARYYTPSGRSIQKPYDDDQQAYHHETLLRLLHADEEPENIPDEKDNPDSTGSESDQATDKTGTSDHYRTRSGRLVFGGGGITPDITIEHETGEHTRFFNIVANRGLIYRFAFDYADRHRRRLENYGTASAFIKGFEISPAAFQAFLEFVREQGVRGEYGRGEESEHLIRTYLKAYIGRNVFGAEAFFPVIHTVDPGFKKAVKIIADQWNEALALLQGPAEQTPEDSAQDVHTP